MAPTNLQTTNSLRNRLRRNNIPMNLTIDTKSAASLQPPKQLKLPFSSPIIDESSSPENSSLASGSSGSGDHPKSRMVGRLSGIEAGTSLSKNDFERALYTDLRQPKEQQEMMQWSSSDAVVTNNYNNKQNGRRKSGVSKRSQRPTGLQVVTNFSRNQSVKKGRDGDNAGDKVGGQPLLDLHGLKQIVLAREKQRIKAKQEQRAPRTKAYNDQKGAGNYTSPQSLEPGSAPMSGLSPSDGSVVIGLGMPYDDSTNGRKNNIARGLAVQNLQAPPTPTILVTPAKEESSWPSDSPDAELHRPRVASSVYSQPTPRILDEDIPPVPAIPDLHSIVRNKDAKRILTAQNTPTMRSERPMSADTVFEDDSPKDRYVTQHTPTMASVLSPGLGDANRPQSQGWWTYLLSPLLKRSSTTSTRRTGFSPRSIPPQSATSFTFKDSTTRGLSEKETSHFSPDTPETGVYRNVDIWSSLEKQGIDESERGLGPTTDDITTGFRAGHVFPNQHVEPNLAGHGLAAEYYLASAHDLSNEEPYFECIGHICSMTTQKRCAEIIKTLQDSENEGAEKSAADMMPASFAILDLLAKMHDPLMAELEKQKAVDENKKSTEDPFSDVNEKALPTEDTRDLISLDDGEARTRVASVTPMARSTRSPSPPPVVEKEPVQEPPRAMPAPREPTPVPMPAMPAPREPTPVPMPAPSQMPPAQIAPAPMAPAMAQPVQMPQMPPPVMQPMVVYAPPMPTQVPAQMPAYIPPPSIPQQPMFQEPIRQSPQQRTMSPVVRMPSPEETITNDTREPAPRGIRPRGMSPVMRMPSPEETTTNDTRGIRPRGMTPQETTSRQMSPVARMPSPEENIENYTREPAPSGLALQGMASRAITPREMAPREISSSPEIAVTQERARERVQRILPPASTPPPPRRPSPAAVRGENPAAPLESSRNISEEDSDSEPPPYYTPPTSRNSSRLRSNNLQSNNLQVGNTRPQRAVSPGPISPGMQREMTSRGGIPMSEVTPFQDEGDTQRDRINGGQIQDQHHGTFPTVGGYLRAEENNNRRRRLQKENSFWKRAGGLLPGRGGTSKKKRDRRWYCAIIIFCIIVIILSVILAICLTHKGDSTPVQSQWLNLTGYPPMPTGVMTVAGPDPAVERSSCVAPSQMWTCALPKEQQDSNTGYASDRPNFRFEISFHNGSYPHSTTVRSSATNSKRSLLLFDRDDAAPSPTPAVPRLVDQKFLGNTTDNVTAPFEGEETPFFITFLSPVDTSDYQSLGKRDTHDNSESTTLSPSTTRSSSPSKTSSTASSTTTSGTGTFADIGNLIPAPAMASDGTASAATLYPLPGSQPIKLYDRGKPTEHYGFYTYFDKSIFIESKIPVTGDNKLKDSDSEDSNGGSTKEKANVRCTWSQTRFLVRIWTQPTNVTNMRITASSSSNSTNATATTTASATTSLSTKSPTSTSSLSANNFTSPGSFPYPITLTVDRHGGLATEKLIYCYSLEQEGYYNLTSPKLEDEDRSSGGSIIQASPGYIALAEVVQQGIKENQTEPVDGGTGGCECEWRNWISLS